MPRYYFDLSDHEDDPDEIGTEMKNDAEARVHAVIFAGEYLKEHPELVWDGKEIRIHVRKEEGGRLLTVVALATDCG